LSLESKLVTRSPSTDWAKRVYTAPWVRFGPLSSVLRGVCETSSEALSRKINGDDEKWQKH